MAGRPTPLVTPLCALALCCPTGCTPTPPAAHLPSLVASPLTDLQLGWDCSKTFHVPPLVVLTADQLNPTLAVWPGRYFTDWPIALPDGRSARVDVAPVDRQPRFCGLRVYRPDGSLLLQEWDNLRGRPNEPGIWVYYAADGRTPRAEVDATHLPAMTLYLYDDRGTLDHIFQADTDHRIIWMEEAVTSDGKIVALNGDPAHYVGPPHDSPVLQRFLSDPDLR